MADEYQAFDVFMNNISRLVKGLCEKLKYDKSFPSTIYKVNLDGTYTIIKDKQEYKVKNALGTTLTLGQNVWVKIPQGSLRNMHIYGVK